MREITVKAFNSRTKKWIYFSIGQQWSDVQRALYSELCLNGATFYQFTGKNDKNGKEIYDGDKVSARYAPQYIKRTFEIKWNNGSASFVCYRKHENPKIQFEQLPLQPPNSMFEDLEITGNKYESNKK